MFGEVVWYIKCCLVKLCDTLNVVCLFSSKVQASFNWSVKAEFVDSSPFNIARFLLLALVTVSGSNAPQSIPQNSQLLACWDNTIDSVQIGFQLTLINWLIVVKKQAVNVKWFYLFLYSIALKTLLLSPIEKNSVLFRQFALYHICKCIL